MLKSIARAGVTALAIIGGIVVINAVMTDGVPPLRVPNKLKNHLTTIEITNRKEAKNEQ